MKAERTTFTKRVVVLMDCTETSSWNKVLSEKVGENDEYVIHEEKDVRPLTAHPRLVALFKRIAEETDKKFCIVLRTSHDAMFLATLIANSLMENRLEEYPVLNPEEIEVYDVYDAELVPALDKEGFLRECGFDSTMRVLMNDYVRLQQLNAPKGPKVEFESAEDHTDTPAMELFPVPVPHPDRTDTLEEEMQSCEDVREVLARRKAEK